MKSESEVAQSCPTHSDPMDCSPPGSAIHGIFQARVLEWGAIAFSKESIVYSNSMDLSLLMKVKEESENVDLQLNIQKMKIMASGTITLWKIDGETVETVLDFIFLGSKITADGDCSHEIKRRLLLGRKVMT